MLFLSYELAKFVEMNTWTARDTTGPSASPLAPWVVIMGYMTYRERKWNNWMSFIHYSFHFFYELLIIQY